MARSFLKRWSITPGPMNVVRATLLAVVLAVLPGCQTATKPDRSFVFFPAPPEKPRVQYVTWASGAEQVEPGRSTFANFVLGEEPTLVRTINKPYGIAMKDGVAYVCDTKGLSICKLDFKNQVFSSFGGRGPGRLRKPINITIDPLGYKFVADTVRKEIVVFGPNDEYVTAHKVPEPCRPVDVAIYENELYVLDNDATCRIVVMDRTSGQVLRTFGGPGGAPGMFKIPGSLCIGPEGYLYVSDTHNWRIQKLTREGKPVWVKGTPGYMLGQFGRPRGINVGPDGTVFVVDGATEIVQMFDKDGNTLMRFGGPGDGDGALGLPATVAIDQGSIPLFAKYFHKDFTVDYLMAVSNQYGPRLVSIFAFGSFPEGYDYQGKKFGTVERLPLGTVREPVDTNQPAPAFPPPDHPSPEEDSQASGGP